MKNIVVTGSAGFIKPLCAKLLDQGKIIGIDNHNKYYDPNLKEERLKILIKYKKYKHHRISLEEKDKLNDIFKTYKPEKVINLAAQAGVRYSIENPLAYINSNIVGFANILEKTVAIIMYLTWYMQALQVYMVQILRCLFRSIIVQIIHYPFMQLQRNPMS